MTTTMVFAYLPQLVKVTFFIHICNGEKDRKFGTTQQTFANKTSTRKRGEICSKLTLKTPERRQ